MKYITVLSFLFVSSCSLVNKADREIASVDRPPQYVLMGFDGSKNLDMWKETTQFAKDTGVKFTYFVSGVYFVANADRKKYYTEPRLGAGKSAIGFGKGEIDISKRFRALRDAINEGHEIASHANAHFTGQKFTDSRGNKIPAFGYNGWMSELKQFDQILRRGVQRYNVARMPAWWNSYLDNKNVGFRAPQLGYNKSMYPALRDNGYEYDTSRIAPADYWPKKIDGGQWNYPLASLRMSRTGKKTLSMDYNFYVKDSKGSKGPASEWKFYEDQMVETYLKYFKGNYLGNRAPIDIGHHFSKWNGGAYWRAMKRFSNTVCNLPEVKCVTYSELTRFLEKNSSSIASYQAGNFRKMKASDVNLPASVKRASLKPDTFTPEEMDELRNEFRNFDRFHEDADESVNI